MLAQYKTLVEAPKTPPMVLQFTTMELCTYTHHLKLFTPPFRTNLKSKLSIQLKPNSISRRNPGLRYYKFNPLKATASEETSGGANQYVKEDLDVVNYLSIETKSPEEESSNGENQYVKEENDGVVTVDEAQSEVESGFGGFNVFKDGDVDASNDQFPQFDFLNKLKVELDLEDSFSIAILGVGSFTVLWLTASIVAAIDHIPLFPKLMEVVGLGYTLWFSTRYLLFKRNRDELASKIEEIKQQVLGSKN